jgi:hypothetical protein
MMFSVALRADPEAGNVRFPVTPPSDCIGPARRKVVVDETMIRA